MSTPVLQSIHATCVRSQQCPHSGDERSICSDYSPVPGMAATPCDIEACKDHVSGSGHSCTQWVRVEHCAKWQEIRGREAREPASLVEKAKAHSGQVRIAAGGMIEDPESVVGNAADYAMLGHSIGELVARKQAAYGNSFGKCGALMRILYPDGINDEKLDDALTVVRVLDKLCRIATDRDALGESPWRDVAGYALLSVSRVEGKK